MARETRTGTLIYPSHQLSPVDFLHFVETDEFADDWKQLGLDVEDDLWAVQMCIMGAADLGSVVPGTGGLRKIRFNPAGWNCGKSGAVRVCYAYFKKHWTVLLIMAYGKGQKETITGQEKQGIKTYLESVERYLDKRNY
jgi:hypothetical protein